MVLCLSGILDDCQQEEVVCLLCLSSIRDLMTPGIYMLIGGGNEGVKLIYLKFDVIPIDSIFNNDLNLICVSVRQIMKLAGSSSQLGVTLRCVTSSIVNAYFHLCSPILTYM